MNVSELYLMAKWLKDHGRTLNSLYLSLQQTIAHNAAQPQKQPLEEQLNQLDDYLKGMNMSQLSSAQIAYLDRFNVGSILGQRGSNFINSTVKKSAYDPATANSDMEEAHNRLMKAIQKAAKILEALSGVAFAKDHELYEPGHVTVRIEFQGQAEIRNVVDWKNWSATWHDIVRGVGRTVNEAPENTKVIGASQGSVIMILAVTYGFTRILALIAKSIASIAKDYLEVRMAAEKLKVIKGFNAENEKKLLENAEEIQKSGVERVIKELKESLDHQLDGDVEAELRRSISKILEFYTKGGEVDFVSPSAEQADADNDGDEVIDEEIIAEIRQEIEAARQAQEEVKLLTSQVDASD